MMLLGLQYTEHVNNNAFTSDTAYYNVQQALSIARQLAVATMRLSIAPKCSLKNCGCQKFSPTAFCRRMIGLWLADN
ncbi:hypothetical protein ACNKHS_07850 [Shigella flexneri]